MAYGLFARLVFGWEPLGDAIGVMSFTFIFVVPVVVGFVSVYTLPGTRSWSAWLGVPITSALLTLVSAMVLAWEGLICIVVWGPIFFVFASVGGMLAGMTRRVENRRHPLMLAGVAIVPFLLAPGEGALPTPVHTRVVEDEIEIDASAAEVWEQIREVAPITPEELGPSFAHQIGFPRPIAARLEGTGVGSVRHASFEGGVVFIETVTEWEENRALAFTISAEDVPPTTFDTHVAVGGPYFDVLDGRYVIEPLAPEAGRERVRLRLASTHRLETRFNGYTRLWTDLFMRDIQQNILAVVKARSEASGVAQSR
ncbi:hypothetical protein BSZ36_15175 [Rubricoccus marinus]|uniref:Polyketide cyclase/dehydrase n=1 Tax=Rubricoccus marinus TaxID=716817 RepID=A0A259U4L2_9BACT|nr:hypothetical protein BSZ36_15175 [Rubricoccus marinus]